jgi:hypothetical protein
VAFGPGGTLAAGYGAGGGGVVLFGADGGRLRPAPLEVKEGPVTGVAFGPGGTLAAGYGGIAVSTGVLRFEAVPASWHRKAAHVANRNFTREEWTQFFRDQPYRRTIRSLPWPNDLPEEEKAQAAAREKDQPEGDGAS